MPAVMLFFLAPVFGEFLLGNLRFTELPLIPFLAPLYGGGAVLIREIARRAGRGYAAMLTLGIAYAIIEEGLVDQLFFNPDYFPGQAGVDAWLILILLAMHAVWSTCIPIALVEGLYPQRAREPWLGPLGLSVVAVIFVAGSVWLGFEVHKEEQFLATPGQFTVAALATVLAIVLAFAFRSAPKAPGAAPSPWFVGSTALVASSLYMLTEPLPRWTREAACLAIAAAFFGAVWHWARRAGWTHLHTLSLAAGGIATYSWLGAFMDPETGPRSTLDHAGTAVLVLFALTLVTLAIRRTANHHKHLTDAP